MKSDYKTRQLLSLVVLLLLMLLTVSAKRTFGQIAQFQIIGVHQAIDATLTPATLGGLHVTFSYTNFGANPVFLSIWARTPNQQNTAPVARNICLSPFVGPRMLERYILVDQLGIPYGSRVPTLDIYAQLTNVPFTFPVAPQPNFNTYTVPLDSLFMFDSPTNELADSVGPDWLLADFAGPIQANVARGCNVPNEDLDNTAHPPVKGGYAGDENVCGPAAVANSLAWLEATIAGVGNDNLTARQRLEELSDLMGRKNAGDGVTAEEIIQAKVSFCAKYKLKVKVEYHAASGDFEEDKKWLDDQYKANQDVELDYSYIDEQGNKKSHAVVLTDVNITGKVPQISIKDDKNQKAPGGNSEEKNLELKPGKNGHITFVRNGRLCTVNNMYAESLDPNAGTFTDPNTNETSETFCALNDKKTCIGACPALIVYYDRAGNPVTTYPVCAGQKSCCDIHELFTPGGTNCAADKKGKCKGQCPELFRSKKDARNGANPVQGDCEKASCNCVYPFIAKKDNKRLAPQQEFEGKLNIYPNPVNQQMNIAVVGFEGTYQLQVINLLGQQLIAKTIELDGSAGTYMLDVSKLASGLYFVMMRNGEQQMGGTFVKE